jgi:hypothetical protein
MLAPQPDAQSTMRAGAGSLGERSPARIPAEDAPGWQPVIA